MPDRPSIMALLFPAQPRRAEWVRWTRISLRSAHLLSFGVLFGGTLLGVEAGLLSLWWTATLVTGLGLVCTFAWESFDWFRQLSGLIVIAKIVVLGSLPAFGDGAAWALGALVVVSSFSSHMPGRIRHWVPPVLRSGA